MNKLRLLNLGCGARFHKDWINFDVAPTDINVRAHDLTKKLPLEDQSIDGVYHSHVLEHLSRPQALEFLKETYRVLKKGSVTRIVVPDLEGQARAYLKTLEGRASAEDHEWMMLEMIDQLTRTSSGGEMSKYIHAKPSNRSFVISRIGREGEELFEAQVGSGISLAQKIKNKPLKVVLSQITYKLQCVLIRIFMGAGALKKFEMGHFRLSGEPHQWMYDRLSLDRILKRIGFAEVRVSSAHESQIPNFANYELDVTNGKVNKPDSLFIEAKK